MHHLRASIEIAIPPEQAWELYADVEGSVAWVPFAEEILSVSGPAGLGQVYRERTRLGGVADVADVADVAEWTIIESDPLIRPENACRHTAAMLLNDAGESGVSPR